VIKSLVERRRAVKKILKNEKNPEKREEVSSRWICCSLHVAIGKSNNLITFYFSVGHSPKSTQVDGQLDVWLSWFLQLTVLCTTNCSHGHCHGT
jgi:hypothetical protein